jgi:hypothetical protein
MAEQQYPSARSPSTTPPARGIFQRRLALVRSDTRAAAHEYIRDRVHMTGRQPQRDRRRNAPRPVDTDSRSTSSGTVTRDVVEAARETLFVGTRPRHRSLKNQRDIALKITA